ncbi:hypothetical protein [Streptomyces alfalfae]|uniref:Uncharacterized protein n=1 Tax=Streptomyces alfalfae TaxID=1642299 RepID=A0A7T4PGK4_9ACTN|nr:hypothetical protein [Streptomyces alfalfae]QQC89744.1 hypothetical protein I8755_15940 [Streptomyces alfalfae]
MPEAPVRTVAPAPPRPPVAATVRQWYGPLSGSASRTVRPYLVAWEGEETSRLRRDALWHAAYDVGLDVHRTLEVV